MKPMRRAEDFERERHERAVAWAARASEAEEAISVCERWVMDLVDGGVELFSRDDLPGLPTELNLGKRLSAAKLDSLSAAIGWQTEVAQGTEPADAAFIGHALAIASGRAYVAHGPRILSWIGHVVATVDHQGWEAFADAAAAELRRNAAKREQFIEQLTEVVQEANDDPDSMSEVPSRRVSIASLIADFGQSGTFQDIWQSDPQPFVFRWSSAFEILRRADPAEFVSLIADLPHPVFMRECLESRALRSDQNKILELLRLSRSSISQDGSFSLERVVTIILLRLANDQLLTTTRPSVEGFYLHGCHEEMTDQVRINDLDSQVLEFQRLATALLDVIFERDDGFELGWCWLENILRHAPWIRRATAGQRDERIVNQIGLLAGALSARLQPRSDYSGWIREAPPLARQYRAIAVLSVAAYSAQPGNIDIGAVAKDLLKEKTFQLTGAKELIRQAGAPMRCVPGEVLAQKADVDSWFEETWSSIRRRREQFWRRNVMDDVPNVAEILTLWGLGALEALSQRPEVGPARCMALWIAVKEALREARLTERRLGVDFWSAALERLFSFWPKLFTSAEDVPAIDGGETFSGSKELGEVLSPFVGCTIDFMGIIVSLRANGIDAQSLQSATVSTGGDLSRLIPAFLRTTRGLDYVGIWNQSWVDALRKLEKDLLGRRPELGTAAQV